MTDLDEDGVGAYLLMIDPQGQYFLWPNIRGVPAGCCIVHGPAPTRDCLDIFERESRAARGVHSALRRVAHDRAPPKRSQH